MGRGNHGRGFKLKSIQKPIVSALRAAFGLQTIAQQTTRTLRIFDGVSQTTTLAYTAGDVITLDVFPYVSNAGLPTGCPALTANKLERVSFTATDSGVIGNNGTTYFYGVLFRVQINNDVYPMTSAKVYELAEGASLGAELFTNPPSRVSGSWVDNGDGSYSKTYNTTGDVGQYWSDAIVEANENFIVSFTIDYDCVDTLNIYSRSDSSNQAILQGLSTGTYETYISTGNGGGIWFARTAFIGTLRDVSIKQLPTKHFQYVNSPTAITLTQDSVTGEWLGGEINDGDPLFSANFAGSNVTSKDLMTIYTETGSYTRLDHVELTQSLPYKFRVAATVDLRTGSIGFSPANEAFYYIIIDSVGKSHVAFDSDSGGLRIKRYWGSEKSDADIINLSVKQLFQLSTFMQAKFKEEQLMAKWEAEKHHPRYFFEGDGATRYIPLPSAITLTGDFEIEFEFVISDTSRRTFLSGAIESTDTVVIDISGNDLRFFAYIGSVFQSAILINATPYADGKIHKLKAKVNAVGLAKLEIDDVLIGSRTWITGQKTVAFFGTRAATTAYLSGSISNIKIHDRGTLVYASRLNRNDGLAINEIGLGDELVNIHNGLLKQSAYIENDKVYINDNTATYDGDYTINIDVQPETQYLVNVELDGDGAYCEVQKRIGGTYIGNTPRGVVSTVGGITRIALRLSRTKTTTGTAVFSNISIRKAPLSAAIVNPEVTPQLYSRISGEHNGWVGKELWTENMWSTTDVTNWVVNSNPDHATSAGVSGSTTYAYKPNIAPVGTLVKMSVNVSQMTSGSGFISLSNGGVTKDLLSDGVYETVGNVTLNSTVYVGARALSAFKVNNISVKRFIEEV